MSLILVIEDEDHIRSNICEILSYEDYDVIDAPNGMVGIELAQQHNPDIVLCDVLMPGITGWDVLLELRSSARTADTQFVFLTALADRASARKGMSHGADDYIAKPFTHRELLDTVATRLRRREEIKHRTDDRLDDLRKTIVHALPHELRSPLTGILSCAEFLLMDHPAGLEVERVQNVARIIERSGRRLQRLVENYLFYAQLEMTAADRARRDGVSRERTENPGGSIYDAAVEVCKSHDRLDDLRHEISSVPVAASSDNLHKLTSELVDNACKFSQPGTPIEVLAFVRDNNYIVTISDQGRGMYPSELENIGAYTQFQRNLFEQQGVGLGLAIVRRLADLYGGTCAIQSAPNTGTTVEVGLKLA
ncbi:MAG: response regulator [Chloroflexi bacterium]|nr:response regulator [Chloroflexota bacterium]